MLPHRRPEQSSGGLPPPRPRARSRSRHSSGQRPPRRQPLHAGAEQVHNRSKCCCCSQGRDGNSLVVRVWAIIIVCPSLPLVVGTRVVSASNTAARRKAAQGPGDTPAGPLNMAGLGAGSQGRGDGSWRRTGRITGLVSLWPGQSTHSLTRIYWGFSVLTLSRRPSHAAKVREWAGSRDGAGKGRGSGSGAQKAKGELWVARGVRRASTSPHKQKPRGRSPFCSYCRNGVHLRPERAVCFFGVLKQHDHSREGRRRTPAPSLAPNNRMDRGWHQAACVQGPPHSFISHDPPREGRPSVRTVTVDGLRTPSGGDRTRRVVATASPHVNKRQGCGTGGGRELLPLLATRVGGWWAVAVCYLTCMCCQAGGQEYALQQGRCWSQQCACGSEMLWYISLRADTGAVEGRRR